LVKGDVWLTETSGIVRWRTPRRLDFPTSTRHATLAMRWLFDWLLPASPRVKRVYLYEWDAAPGAAWDSALIGLDGKSRPALRVVRRVVKNGIRRPRRGETKARRRWVQRHLGQ
jgi:hypothetical protein